MKPAELNPIKKRRVLMGLTQPELADQAGVSEATVWNAENGFYELSVETARKIGKVFQLKAGTLVNEWLQWKEGRDDVQPG